MKNSAENVTYAKQATMPVCLNKNYEQPISDKKVTILLATYNGERFVSELVESIRDQSFSDWTLFVRDDGSSDDTIAIIRKLANEDKRIVLVADDLDNQGVIGNFSMLMWVALQEKSDYIFFADQDDVWRHDKLHAMLSAMQHLESEHENLPLLVHSDLAVVDSNLEIIHKSFIKYMRLSPLAAHLGVLFCQNQVTGCASLINRRLLELAYPVPGGVLMHDWWIALLAAATGKIGYIPKRLVSYRQHSNNVLGATSLYKRIMLLLFSRDEWRKHMHVIRGGITQAHLLDQRLHVKKIEIQKSILMQIRAYTTVLLRSPIYRVIYISRHGIGRPVGRSWVIFNILLTVMGRL